MVMPFLLSLLLQKQLDDRLETFAFESRAGIDGGLCVEAMHILCKTLDIKVGIGLQVDLVDEYHIGGLEQQRILEGLVVALGNAGYTDTQMLAQQELGGADQIADIVDDNGLDPFQIKLRQGMLDHIGLQMAGALGVELDGADTDLLHALGILGGIEVALDDGHPPAVDARIGQHLLEQGGLAAARCAQQIDHADAALRQVFFISGGNFIVFIEYADVDGDGFHGLFSSEGLDIHLRRAAEVFIPLNGDDGLFHTGALADDIEIKIKLALVDAGIGAYGQHDLVDLCNIVLPCGFSNDIDDLPADGALVHPTYPWASRS